MLQPLLRFFRDRPRFPLTFACVPLAVAALAAVLALQLALSTPMDGEHALQVALETWRKPFVASCWAIIGIAALPLGGGRWRLTLPLHALWFGVFLLGSATVFPPVSDRPPREFGGPPFAREERMRPPPMEEGGPPRGRRLWPLFVSTAGQLTVVTYFGTIVLVQALLLARDVRERDRRARELAAGLSRARLQALQLQLQPHFLFNSLNAISTLVHKDAAAADEMISNLGELLRLSLATSAPAVPLREELALLDRYLAIEQVRFGPRLCVEREIAPDALGAFVPTLLLQPIVENAVRHGLEPKPGPGLVRLAATVDGGRLRLVVADDGVGMARRDDGEPAGGVGLENSTARLREIYGAAASLRLEPNPGGGTRVVIELPVATSLRALGIASGSA